MLATEPAQRMTLTAHDQRTALKLALKAGSTDFSEFLRITGRKYIVGRFQQFLAQKMEKVVTGQIKRLIIATPPRHGKSRLCAVRLPAYALGQNPALNIIVSGHKIDLPTGFSEECQQIVTSQIYGELFPDTRIRQDRRAPEHWKTTAGGGYQAAGVGTGLSGYDSDLLIVDDYFADHAQAHSLAYRDKVWRWFTSTARIRLSPGGAIIIIATRWDPDDLVGRLLDKTRRMEMVESGMELLPWEIISLPAFATTNDVLGRKPGEPLFPERWSARELLITKSETTRHDWSALFECNPIPEGGNYVNVSNFKIRRRSEVPPNQRYARAWDLATDEKTWLDLTAGAYGFIHEKELWITDITAGQWAWPHARERIAMLGRQESCPIGVEGVGGFATSIANLKEVAPELVVRTLIPTKDKLTRANPWIALLDNKKINLVEGPWVNDFLNDCQQFPSPGGKKDRVDAVSLLYFMLQTIGSGGTVVSTKGSGIVMQKFPRHGRTGF
jgi:hypothetical protein